VDILTLLGVGLAGQVGKLPGVGLAAQVGTLSGVGLAGPVGTLPGEGVDAARTPVEVHTSDPEQVDIDCTAGQGTGQDNSAVLSW
jgi:hypothetical protein